MPEGCRFESYLRSFLIVLLTCCLRQSQQCFNSESIRHLANFLPFAGLAKLRPHPRNYPEHPSMTRKNKKGSTGRDRLRRREPLPEVPPVSSIENLIVIGASAGGHSAVKEVLRELSPDIPAALIILQHMPSPS